MLIWTCIFPLLALIPHALAVPGISTFNRPETNSSISNTLEKRQAFTGRTTFYAPGLGACGLTHTASDAVVALNIAQFGSGVYPGVECFKYITITYGSKPPVSAQIVDMCPGCPLGGLDLSPAVFNQLENPDKGVIEVSWVFEGGAAVPVPPPPAQQTTTIPVPAVPGITTSIPPIPVVTTAKPPAPAIPTPLPPVPQPPAPPAPQVSSFSTGIVPPVPQDAVVPPADPVPVYHREPTLSRYGHRKGRPQGDREGKPACRARTRRKKRDDVLVV